MKSNAHPCALFEPSCGLYCFEIFLSIDSRFDWIEDISYIVDVLGYLVAFVKFLDSIF